MSVRHLLAACALAMLAACGSGEDAGDAVPADAPGEAATPTAPAGPSPEQLAALDSRDCRTVAEGYFRALERGDFGFAAEFWNDPVIDGPRLDALFDAYVTPRVEIGEIGEEGAAGSLYCTVTGTLGDASDPRVAESAGEIVLRRVNDVPGASEEQLRWTIRSSTFGEPMERSSKGQAG